MVKLKSKKYRDVSGAVIDESAKLKRRSSMEMDIAILQILEGHKLLRKTHIMYKANVNANILREKLVVLQERGLIESHKILRAGQKQPCGKQVFYGLTAKGREVLQCCLFAYDAFGCVEQ
ncbi:MAG TPA: winged helix-turn-helix domain-containing protein [Candidatus Binatia bacterium]|nr:winged helix-turn-helix domain-containing protein [Candidatus Binatia bacterium]